MGERSNQWPQHEPVTGSLGAVSPEKSEVAARAGDAQGRGLVGAGAGSR